MDFFGKDKLSRLDEERQRRRQQRAEEALRRLEEVGKQTQQLVTNHQTTAPSTAPEATDASGRRPGGLSRVLFEQATNGGGDRKRKNKLDPRLLMSEGEKALQQVNHAMSTIQNSVVDATGAGLRGGLEEASKSVTDIVDRVASFASGATGTLSPSANKNPLAQLMAEEQEEELKQNQESDQDQAEDNKSKLTLEGKLDGMKQLAQAATDGKLDMNANVGGGEDEDTVGFKLGAKLQGALPHEAMQNVAQEAQSVSNAMSKMLEGGMFEAGSGGNVRELAANAATKVISQGDPANALGVAMRDTASAVAEAVGGGIGGAANAGMNFLRDPLGSIKDGAGAIADAVKNPAGVLLDMKLVVGSPAGPGGGAGFGFGDLIKNAGETISDAAQGIASNLGEVPTAGFAGVLDTAKTAAGAAAGAITDAAGVLNPQNVISNIGNALDPANFGKLANTLNPTNLINIAGQALDNVTARLKNVAEQLDPNAQLELIRTLRVRVELLGDDRASDWQAPARASHNAVGGAPRR